MPRRRARRRGAAGRRPRESVLRCLSGPLAARSFRSGEPDGQVRPRQPDQNIHRHLQARSHRSAPHAGPLRRDRHRAGFGWRREMSAGRRPGEAWREWLRRLAGLVVLTALVGGAWAGVNRFRKTQAAVELPVATARKGEFVAIIRCRGDIKAARSVPIYAPVVPNLTIAWMAPAGEQVQEGSPVIRFDSSSAQQQLIQKEAALNQAQATLDQATGQAQITAEHDQSDLLDAKYNVEKARLQTVGNEFVSRIQAEQAKVEVMVAEQKLRVQEANVALHAAADKSKMASLTRQRDQA